MSLPFAVEWNREEQRDIPPETNSVPFLVAFPGDPLAKKGAGRVMRSFLDQVKRFLHGEDGPTAAEYAVMLGLIILVCFAAIGILGQTTNTTFNAPKLVDALDPNGGS